MSAKSTACGLAALAALTAGAISAHANLVQNGGFENYTGTAPKDYFTNVKPSFWTGGGNLTFVDAPGTADGPVYLSVYGPFPATSPNGGNFVEADGDPRFSDAFSQSISGLIPGASYTLSFEQAAGQQKGFTGQTFEYWRVSLGSDTRNSAEMINPSQGVTPWQPQALTFVANAATETLTFLAVGGLTSGSTVNEPPIVFLDGVDLERVPEPASLTLLGAGLLALGASRRRRRSRPSAA